MNGDFNNFNRDNNDLPEKNETPVQPPVNPAPFSGGEPVNDPVNNNEEKKAPSADAPRPEANGEYRYTGSSLDHRRDDMGTGEDFGASYTHRGSYNRNGYRDPSSYQDHENGGWQDPDRRGYQDPRMGHNPPPYGGGMYPPSPANGKKKQKKNGVSAGALAVTVAASILLSAAAGFGGAYIYGQMNGGGEAVSAEQGGFTVLHRTVETEMSTSTGAESTYTEVASMVKDSVVEITTEFRVTGFFQYVSEGAGSGVIISEDGYVITNNHVISDSSTGGAADSIKVRLTDGTEYSATLVGKDADSDIAVIKIDAEKKLSYAVFGDSDNLAVGEEVMAVGNPLGELGGTVTNGIISALDREISVDGTTMNLLQTNAAINPGNSGGGLFNMKGELVGVVNAKSSGSGIEGLGFAIPVNEAREVAEQLMTNGYVTGKVYIGVNFYEATDAYTAYRYFKSQATGLYVAKTVEGYNDKVLEYGDRIVAIDGKEIANFSEIKDLLKEHSVGDTLTFSIYRSGKLTEVKVTCYEYVPEDAAVNFEDDKRPAETADEDEVNRG